jgi:hypothetical protein
MTPWEGYGIRSDSGVLLRCVGREALRVERWDGRTWVPTGRSVVDFDTLPLTRPDQMRELYSAEEWVVLEAAEKDWPFALMNAARLLADAR